MKVVFKNGKIVDEECKNFDNLIEELKASQNFIQSLEMPDLLKFIDKAAKYWENNKELEKKAGGTLKHLAGYMKKENSEQMLNFSLRGNYKILDKFIDLGNAKYVYHCQPRGLVSHWLPGNVAFLGFYSILQALLTKNVSLAKASPKAFKELLFLLESLNKVNTEKIKGNELLKSVYVVLIDNNDKENQEKMSQAADVRIAWGSHKAINAITSLKKNIFCEDIIFGPKYSYGLIGKEALENYKKIAGKLAFDVCTFDQYACSSPHTVFVQESDEVSAEKFAEELAKSIGFVTKKFLPKEDKNPGKKVEILAARAKGSMTGKVFASKNTDWTVVYSEEKGLSDACFSRVIFVKPIKDLKELGEYNDRRKQTIGMALECQNRGEIVDFITKKGVDRCPQFGEMTFYEIPWDGFFALDRMVRWVSLYKN